MHARAVATHRRLHAWFLLAGLLVAAPGGAQDLRVLGEEYPRAFFFRVAEARAARPDVSYPRWERSHERLMGILGKVLEEEIPGRSRRNIEFFARFKQNHPDQVVLLHYNGNARDPRWESSRFFAGHWLYHNGARVLSDLPAEEGVSEVRVSDTKLFRVGTGRYRTSNEDVGLCVLDEHGRPDWRQSEQVELLSIDTEKGTLRIRRGCFGTEPRAFPAGRTYAAAHCTEGPWGRRSNLLWLYNYSTVCPRDEEGKTCADVHVEHLAELFAPGGPLADFDGLEFDVLHHEVAGGGRGRGPDCDADGVADRGRVGGVDTYGRGVIDFCRDLRRRLGPTRILQADGGFERSQRAFGILNGIESEGWPGLRDPQMHDWSGGLNRHFFWHANAYRPVFNYINHKYIEPTGVPGKVGRPEVPFKVHRLVFAAAVFTDSAICYSFLPPSDPSGMTPIWDELRMGREERLGWLGRHLAPPVHLALREPDLLEGTGRNPGRLLEKLAGEEAFLERSTGAVKARADGSRQGLSLRLLDVPCEGPDLFVSVTLRSEPIDPQRPAMPRLAHVGIAPSRGRLVREDPPPVTGMKLRGEKEGPIRPESGATVAFRPDVTMEGDSHDAYFVHPPYRSGAAGSTFWERSASVSPGARLELWTGMGAKSPERSDGVDFRIEARVEESDRAREILAVSQKEHAWVHRVVRLGPCEGKLVRFRFICDCGPDDDTTTDHAYWGDVRIVDPSAADKGATRPVRFMTFVGSSSFRSTFYFSEIRSSLVDLEIEAEDSAPLWIEEVTAHAHPDVMFRAFERGLVLANPSPRPFTLDLKQLFPAQAFRRLEGTEGQDRETNDGSLVGRTVTLSAREGLFLVRHVP